MNTADRTWWDVMEPVRDSELWHPRIAATDHIIRIMGEDSGCGISSSDINHTIYGAGDYLRRNGLPFTPADILRNLRS